MFTIKGVPPGKYSINANAQAAQPPGTTGQAGAGGGRAAGAGAAGGQWILKSASAGGRDILDFPLVIEPNQEVSGVTLTFVDRNQEVSGTIQDTMGKPTADFTIIIFARTVVLGAPSPQDQSARPPDGKFTFRNLPPVSIDSRR
jgi:hypothetical protein